MIYPPPEPPSRRLHQRALDLIFPPRCVGCRRPGQWICLRCWPQIPWLPDGECIHCSRPVTTGRLCALCLHAAAMAAGSLPVNPFAMAAHEGIGRQAIHELKYTPHTDIATVIGPVMASRLPDDLECLVVPVPLHWSRKRQRGFNQSELLARTLARDKGWLVKADGLFRRRRTRHQVGLEPDERRENVRGAFRWEGPDIRLPVMLVDDVYTTGATLNACASALRARGATTVHACVFACAKVSSQASGRLTADA